MARKKDSNLKPGMRVSCIGDEKWKHPFQGVIEFIRKGSVVVIIESTHEEDDHLIDERHGKTVVNKKKIKIC